MKGIDSKERVFCQCGGRALQQETRPRWTQAGFSQRGHCSSQWMTWQVVKSRLQTSI